MPNEPIVVGGPGDAHVVAPVVPPVVATAAVTTRRVSIGGIDYDVPAALADGLIRERDRAAGEFGSRAQAYERRLAELETAAEPETDRGPKKPDPRDIQYDPEKFARENLAYTEALVANAAQGVEDRRAVERQTEYEQNQKNRAWAAHVDQFYKDHPEFKGDEDIVDTVWQRNFPRIGKMSVEDGFAELAKLASVRIMAVAEKGKALKSTVPTLETSRSSRRAPATPVEETNEPNIGGISAAIKAKQARFKMPYAKSA